MSATATQSAEMEGVLPPSARRRNTVLPGGIDITTFRPIQREEARRELDWEPDEFVALFAATKPWVPRKRQWLAAEACAVAARELGRDVRLEVAGNLAPESMPLLMNAADCLLMTSSIEGSPNAVREALMCNLPVVATPAGDIEALIDGTSPSYLCAPDADEIAAALVSCLRERRRSNGRELASSLSDEAITERLIGIYRSLAPDAALVSA
jgi:glycosyltransferase involved in cell wall biosynthesis